MPASTLISPKAVSYTHLDVYKRQMWGNILCLWLGLLNLLAAGCDTTILYELLKCRKENGGDLLIVDHPNQCGFVAFRKNYEKIEVS